MYRTLFIVMLLIVQHKIMGQRLTSKWDSICYAIGIVWHDDLLQHHIKVNPTAFARGVTSFYKNDTVIFSLKKSYDFLEQHEKQWENDTISPLLRDSLSYALGFTWAKNIYSAGIPFPDTSFILAGMYAKNPSYVTVEQAKKILIHYLEKLREEEYMGIKLLNEKWLSDNKKNAGVIVLANGVQYKILKPSVQPEKPSDTSVFVLSYKAMLIDGTVFEQSQKPEKFYLSALIPGLHEVLLSMRVGEKREVYIPYQLAYGSGGIKNTVPPFATVIYEIELVDLE